MKKALLFVATIALVSGAMAQRIADITARGARINKIEQLATKTNPTHQMTDFRSSDNIEFTYYTYDWQHKLMTVQEIYVGEYDVIDSLTYNEMGQLTRLSGWQMLSGTRQLVYYIDYTYDANGNIASRTNYNRYSGSYELGGIYDYTYNADNKIQRTTLTMGGTIFQQINYDYNPDGTLATETWMGYRGMGASLGVDQKICYHYVDGNLSMMTDSMTDDEGRTWEFYERYEYVYDEDGNCTERRGYDGVGEKSRSIYVFDYSITRAETVIPWDPEILRPETFNNKHVYTTEQYWTIDVDHVLQYMCDYQYNYTTASSAIENNDNPTFSMMPNPAQDYFVIDGLTSENSTLQIFDAMGRVVLQNQVSAGSNRVNIATLSHGIYIVRISNSNGTTSSKLMVD